MSQREISLLRTLALTLFCYALGTVPLGAVLLASYNETDAGHLTLIEACGLTSLISIFASPMIYLWRFNEIRIKFINLFVCKQ